MSEIIEDRKAFNTSPNEVEVLTYESFYNEMVSSSSRFVSPEKQENIRNSKILVAGCGSVGSPIVEMLVRQGCENIIAADPDVVENSNLNRQFFEFWQVGKNKAQACILNARLINPVPPLKVDVTEESDPHPIKVVKEENCGKGLSSVKEGVTYDNVKELVRNSDIVVDAIDISALDMIYELHKEASIQHKPVIVGYDMAGTALVVVYRYDKKEISPLYGELNEKQIEVFKKAQKAKREGKITSDQFMDFVYDAFTGPIKPLDVPVEQFEEILSRKGGEKVPQIGVTSRALSVLATETITRIANGEQVKDTILVDVPSLVRNTNPSVFKKFPLMIRTLIKMNKRAKSVNLTLSNI